MPGTQSGTMENYGRGARGYKMSNANGFCPSGVFAAQSPKIKVVYAKPRCGKALSDAAFPKPGNIGVSLMKFVYCKSNLAKTPLGHILAFG